MTYWFECSCHEVWTATQAIPAYEHAYATDHNTVLVELQESDRFSNSFQVFLRPLVQGRESGQQIDLGKIVQIKSLEFENERLREKLEVLEKEREISMCEYDSRGDTLKHSQRVGELMVKMINELTERSTCHDRSKTEAPEVEIFDEYTPKLKDLTYGSDEYTQCLVEMKPALDHHYANNRHHPEHFTHGVNDMTLVDLIEMLADWKAATERTNSGDLQRSLGINKERFKISTQLNCILENTAKHFGMI